MSKEKTIGKNPISKTIKKILNHISYKRSFGTPDFDEGFLGLSTMQWMNYHSRLWDIADWFKWKKHHLKLGFNILKRPTKIGSSIETYNEAIKFLNEAYGEERDRVIYLESVVEELIEYYAESTKDKEQRYDHIAIKEKYEDIFGERYGVPKEYRDPEEKEDDDCHCPRCDGVDGDYIANADAKDVADWRIAELKELGLYNEEQQ
tara:strand:- start:1411 stop:2025 length:615 start_codon:yes stop_codon:yes gene_type:complete